MRNSTETLNLFLKCFLQNIRSVSLYVSQETGVPLFSCREWMFLKKYKGKHHLCFLGNISETFDMFLKCFPIKILIISQELYIKNPTNRCFLWKHQWVPS